MKNKKIIIIGLLITIIIVLMSVVIYKKRTYSIGIDEYSLSRNDIQNLVVSTALSYLYNHNYSNYENQSMDKRQSGNYDNTTFYFFHTSISPEEINRGNRLNTACSGFAFITYLYSLGYDTSDYMELFSNDNQKFIQYNYSKNDFEYTTYNSNLTNAEDKFYKMYNDLGKLVGTYYYSKIAAYDLAGYNTEGFASSFTKNMGQEFKNNSNTNKNTGVYFYKVKQLKSDGNYTETEAEKNQIKQNIEKILQPGDIIIYRRLNREDNTTATGHAILYVGEAINKGEKGIIHSTGADYIFDDKNYNNIDPKDETATGNGYSIRYDTLDYFFNYDRGIFGDNEKVSTYSIAIVRPINRYCNGNDCIIKRLESNFKEYKNDKNSLSNAITRNELSNLRIEQYSTYSTYNSSDSATKSETNSLNNGDKITYKLYMENESKLGYCSGAGGEYSTETKCLEKGYTWKTRDEKQTYSGLTITGIIPEGTTFEECNYNCVPIKEGDKVVEVVWDNVSFSENGYRTYKYDVTVNKDSDVTNPGITIETPTDNILHMGEIKTKVNPTFTQKDAENIEKAKNLLENSATSQLDYVKKLYTNTYGLDLKMLTEDNIKNAIFKNSTGDGYNVFTKIIDSEVSKITNNNYKLINKMLIPGMYGGRLVKGNDNLDRIKYISTFSYEYGDIIITFNNNATDMKMYIFLGRDNNSSAKVIMYDQGEIVEYNGSTSPSGYNMITRVFAQDLFVVLRPSRLGTTVRLKYKDENNNEANESLVMFNKYKNLPTFNDKQYEIEFNNLQTPIDKMTSKSQYNWYSDKEYTNTVSEGSTIKSTNTHTLYGKWSDYEKIELPTPEKAGYKFKGWYSDSKLTSFVGNGGEEIVPTKDMTLYAKFDETYTITYNLNGGMNNLNNPDEFTPNEKLVLNIPTKEGYIFIGWYLDSEFIQKLANNTISIGTSDNITLYAKWIEVSSEDRLESLDEKIIIDRSNLIIKGLDINTKIDIFAPKLDTTFTVKYYDKNNQELVSTDIMKTGNIIKFINTKNESIDMQISVKGDTTGDGNMNVMDIVDIANHITKIKALEGVYYTSGDYDENNNINVMDIVKMANKILSK